MKRLAPVHRTRTLGPIWHGSPRRLIAEGLGTAFLLAAVVGSGIMADRLFAGNQGLALLANSLATGAALMALIHTFGPISGAHFNPVVTLAERAGLPWWSIAGYIAAQLAGAMLGVWMAHAMFGERVFMLSHHARSGAAQWFSEFVATFGLLAVITGCCAPALGGWCPSPWPRTSPRPTGSRHRPRSPTPP